MPAGTSQYVHITIGNQRQSLGYASPNITLNRRAFLPELGGIPWSISGALLNFRDQAKQLPCNAISNIVSVNKHGHFYLSDNASDCRTVGGSQLAAAAFQDEWGAPMLSLHPSTIVYK